MKKAKIMLSAIAVLAIVGGTLAFKASSFAPTKLYTCTTVNAQPSTCSVFDAGFSTTVLNGGAEFTQATVTNAFDSPDGQGCDAGNCLHDLSVVQE
jgi:hypothetical protein